jgi:hypothetical protein
MSHHFSKFIKQRQEQELKKMQDKLLQPKICKSCNDPAFMSLLEVTERIHSWSEEKQTYEFVDTSKYFEFRCISCNFEEIAK